jgi:Arc/MetJ-type ribon-helix-helix transcriptional regulator
MPVQLTVEQEQRLQAVVRAGAYSSEQDALDAALTIAERAASPEFDGGADELESLMMDGLKSTELSEEAFWRSVESETGAALAVHKAGLR